MAGQTAVFYISGHGFGHASRAIEVINALQQEAPGLRVVVRTSAARWLFDLTLRGSAAYQPARCDTGVIQTDSLHLDVEATLREAWQFQEHLADRAAVEARLLEDAGATVVVGDIPPLAFAAAALAGVPAVGVGNFTWDWIYEAYAEVRRLAPDLGPGIRRAYSSAALALRLPMWGGFEGWRCPVIDVPFVARHSTRAPDQVRDQIGVRPGCRMVLASFGGLGISGLDLRSLGSVPGYHVVTTGHALRIDGSVPDGVTVLPDREIYASGLRYEDLVRAADVVVTKPGYGIIAECLANGAAIVYTSRGPFAEYDILVEAMPRFLRCEYIDHDHLLAGRWAGALDRVLAQPAPAHAPATNGAEVASRAILRAAGTRL